MNNGQGQITPDSLFGSLLTQFAKLSRVIVEIGTLTGEGSTRCLHMGLHRPDQVLVGIDVCKESAEAAQSRYKNDNRVRIVHGHICPIEAYASFPGHPHRDGREWFEAEKHLTANSPNVINEMPPLIDLLLIDGGEFGASQEFRLLAPRSKYIALDDTMSFKNVWNRSAIVTDRDTYEILADVPDDRNGFMIAKRRAA